MKRTKLAISLGLPVISFILICSSIATFVKEPLFIGLYCVAAILLDAFKYIALPSAVSMYKEGNKDLAFSLGTVAITLAIFAGVSNFDRISNSLLTRNIEVEKYYSELNTYESARKIDLQRLSALSSTEQGIAEQSKILRDKGMASQAKAYEETERNRVSAERSVIMERLDRKQPDKPTSQEIPFLIVFIISGILSVGMEIVPWLIMLSSTPAPAKVEEELPQVHAEPKLDPLSESAILEYAKSVHPSDFSISSYAKAFDVAPQHVAEKFHALRDKGLLVNHGKRYKLKEQE